MATPQSYVCRQCGVSGVRLYRKYMSSCVELRCRKCTIEHEGQGAEKTKMESNIGWSVAAVPVDGNCSDWWGYTAVPQDLADWWYSLPTETAKGGAT